LPSVLRVDGVHFRRGPKERWRNEQIRKAIKKSDLVIFQSEFAKKTVTKTLGIVPRRTRVIHNGARVEDYIGLKVPSGYREQKCNVLMAARWGDRESKNLKGHLLVAKEMEGTGVHFWLAGETSKKIRDTENMTVLGKLDDKELRPHQAHADCMLYIPKWDWCSNAVIECLVAGTPVLTRKKIEGVSELVGRDGGWCVDSYEDVLMCLRNTVPGTHLQGFCLYRFFIGEIAKQYKDAFIATQGC
jgi:glycosyltransferase involved in cell wall biosynthesis